MAKTKVQSITLEPGALYTTAEVAAYFKSTENSLAVRRHLGRFTCAIVRDGDRVLYRGSDVLEYARKNTDASGRARTLSPRKKSPGRPPGKTRRAA